MFDILPVVPADPILSVLARFREDARLDKIDVGVGVYRDEHGRTPVMAAVKQAETRLLAEQISKSYVAAAGDPAFNLGVERLVLGDDHPALAAGRTRVIQVPGGSGALRLGGELIRAAHPESTVYVSDPAWVNHRPLLEGAGLVVAAYPYLDVCTGQLRFDDMLVHLQRLPPLSVVLLQACCHNPSGVDLSILQWQQVADVLRERRLIPFVDITYQGLGQGLEWDAFGLRLLAQQVPELLVAVSCSKNFGLYRERVGALIVLARDKRDAVAAASHVLRFARAMYFMASDHGAAVVKMILGDAELRAEWSAELATMNRRIREIRHALATELVKHAGDGRFAAIDQERGMFSLLPLSPEQVERLRSEHHVYMLSDGRINVAGLTRSTVPRFAAAVAQVLG